MTLKEQFETTYKSKFGLERYCMLKLDDISYYLTNYSEWLEAQNTQLQFQLKDKLNSVEGGYETMDILIQEQFPNHKFSDKHELSFKQFDYHDMLHFADLISISQMKKKVEEVKPFIKLAEELLRANQSVFKSLDISKEDKKSILFKLNYSDNGIF